MADCKRLGDYIREVNVRNRELKVTNLLGLSMTKQFLPWASLSLSTQPVPITFSLPAMPPQVRASLCVQWQAATM